MAYKVIILYRLYMPSYVLGTFTEYPYLESAYSICLSNTNNNNTIKIHPFETQS